MSQSGNVLGVFVTEAGQSEPFLVWQGQLHHWTPTGYDSCRPVQPAAVVDVLTPASTVRAIAAGYVPIVHPSIVDRSVV